jgi:queuine/archaeosine tRNA-ribosyltransferase
MNSFLADMEYTQTVEGTLSRLPASSQYITGTDSRTHSFQMVSLLQLAQVTEEGVRFLSPHDKTPMSVTPNP